MDQLFLDPPGTAAIQLRLHNYQSNVALYDRWHEYFRRHQPRTLILWRRFNSVPGHHVFNELAEIVKPV